MSTLFVLDKNTWKYMITWKLFILDNNTWLHRIVCKLFILDKNTSSSCRDINTDIPDPILAILLYRPLLPPGLQGYIPYLLRAAVYWFLAGSPAFARPCEGVHRSTSLMSSSLLLQQCPACLVRLTWIVFMIGGKWPYSCCFEGCCLQHLFNIACSIVV